MNSRPIDTISNCLLAVALCVAGSVVFGAMPEGLALPSPQQAPPAASAPAANRRMGAIKTISGTTITLTPDSGPDVNITLQPTTRILRIAPGEKDRKNATPIQVQDLQIGDRILVGGKIADDNSTLAASTVVVMKHADLEARHQQDLQDWQKRGVGGLVTAVDPAAGTVTISVRKKDVVIHSSATTTVRRYAPDSWVFDEAKPSTLQAIHPGDQVTARGERNADGGDLTAEEIVAGSFPLFPAILNSVDAGSSTLSVRDLSSNKTVLVKVTKDSQLHRLPPELAQMIAMRLKSPSGGAPNGTASNTGAAPNGETSRPTGAPGGMAAAGTGAGGRPGGAPDIQRLINRAPAVSVADLHKGDAVVILSTEASAGAGTVITLVSGVEPILQAAPNAAQAMMLAPWSLGGPSGDVGGP
jgi:hypothetical protein